MTPPVCPQLRLTLRRQPQLRAATVVDGRGGARGLQPCDPPACWSLLLDSLLAIRPACCTVLVSSLRVILSPGVFLGLGFTFKDFNGKRT